MTTTILFAGIGLIFFLVIIILFIAYIARKRRLRLKKVVDAQPGTGGAASGIKEMFSSLWGTGKGFWDAVGGRVAGVVLWIFVLISFGALFPEAFAAWWGHQNIFWVSQLVAVLLIFFLQPKYSAPLFGLVIVVMLWNAVDTTFVPQPPREVATQKEIAPKGREVPKKLVTYTITHDKWTMVEVPDKYWFYFDCFGRVEVEILDNRIPMGICDNRDPSWVGSKIKPAHGTTSGVFLMRAIDESAVKVIVKTRPM